VAERVGVHIRRAVRVGAERPHHCLVPTNRSKMVRQPPKARLGTEHIRADAPQRRDTEVVSVPNSAVKVARRLLCTLNE
jgi:hypothetical protein